MNLIPPAESLDERSIPVTGTDALVDLAAKMGLDPAVVRSALETRRYHGAAAAADLPTTSAAPATAADAPSGEPLPDSDIPSIVIDGRYAVIGSRGDDVLLGVLWQAQLDPGALCAFGGCPSTLV